MDDLIHGAFCDELSAFLEENADQLDQIAGHWSNRLLSMAAISKARPDWGEKIRLIMGAAVSHVRAFYGVSSWLYADTLNLTAWREGMSMAPHADGAYSDGRQAEMAHREYSGLFYLSDDFTGGGLYLPRQDVLIQPRKGMFVSLRSGMSHEHAVVRVESGTRYTMSSFLTSDPAFRYPALYRDGMLSDA